MIVFTFLRQGPFLKLFTAMVFSIFSSIVFAKEAPPSSWNPAADAVCAQIQMAVTYYQKGDIKHAKLSALMAYFKGYDAEIEPAIRVTLGGPHVFAIEKKFRDFASSISTKQLKAISEMATALCQEVKKDAAVLDKEKVPRQVFKVE